MKDKDILIIIVVLIFAVVAIIVLKPKLSNYSDDDPMLDKVRYNFSLLNPKYVNIPLREGNSSYTENKKVITLCLRNPDTGKYYDINTIMYVAIHELAHVISKTQGHNNEFKKNFSLLLGKSAKIGIYDPRKEIPQTYCGVGSDD